ncbi:MAG: amylo-alpha-1,6-glucosidase [Desulfuromonadales bacterium]|nr:amylo-alpha-1,6-glucosidase [Desulfuromonadales bacterium]
MNTQDVIQINDQFYILATSSLASDLSRVLKQGETFAVFDGHGDILSLGMGEEGIYHEGTRYLSSLELRVGGTRPLLLGSNVNEHNELLAVDLMNPDLEDEEGRLVHRDSLHLFRSKFLWQGSCFEQLRITNFSLASISVPLTFSFNADYADIFEVRGSKRTGRGRRLEDAVSSSSVLLAYQGLDGEIRRTRLSFSPEPIELSATQATFRVKLEPNQETRISITVTCECEGCEVQMASYKSAFTVAKRELETLRQQNCQITSSNEQFNLWVNRSLADLQMMLTRTPHGLYPYAGVPWFSTAFGRDGIITAFEMLWVNPQIARGVLSFLAATQATAENAEQDAEPGKIIHETRKGEMAALGEIPFGRYYGSVDSTPLFVSLAGAYFERTGDQAFIESIWPNIRLALDWMDRYGDADGDGFLEYARHTPKGLLQQGWKDSCDSVFHADGTLAEGPIALCEVQGYAFEARSRGAVLAELMGETQLAGELHGQAEELRQRFVQAFWCEELGSYALALDGRKRPCRVRASNAGHNLFSGIALPEHARRLAQTLLAESSFSGWGIRTLASGEVRYNPMSYHNGSIWPHDNAMVAFGLARYGFTGPAMRVMTALYNTSIAMDLHRLPELFCGFRCRPGLGPILYPLSCAPQAWAAGAVFMLLQACLGLSIDARQKVVRFRYPELPPFLSEVWIRDLRVAGASVDLSLRRYADDVAINVLRREGAVEVVVIK